MSVHFLQLVLEYDDEVLHVDNAAATVVSDDVVEVTDENRHLVA